MDKFKAIAAIYIYHKADLKYKKEAKQGFKWLKSNKEIAEEILDDTSVLSERSVENVNPNVFWRAYNKLFEEIVCEKFPNFIPKFDYYGARCFEFNDIEYLAGDGLDSYPYYLDKEALMKRLDELALEID